MIWLWRSLNPLAILLLPFGLLYYAILKLRKFLSRPTKVNAFVICVGSNYVGGAGKTPVAIAIAKLFKNRKVAFVSRGYKGSLSSYYKAVKVKSEFTASQVGDEAKLLSLVHPTYISKNRYMAAALAIKDGADVLILDDGLQNFDLKYDLTINLYDTKAKGNSLIFPAGPYRDPWGKADISIDMAHVKYKVINPPNFKECIAFCGIARPEKFLYTLAELNLKVVDFITYTDHHNYSAKDISLLKNKHLISGVVLVTTAKDFIKLPKSSHSFIYPINIEAMLPGNIIQDLMIDLK